MSIRCWLFDLDDTLHDASRAVFPEIDRLMNAYLHQHLGVSLLEANRLRLHYWQEYGATLAGMMRHHQTQPAHFLWHTHQFDDLSPLLYIDPHWHRVLKRLKGDKWVLTNSPRHYAEAVLRALGLRHYFRGVIALQDLHYHPKPRRRAFTLALRRAGQQARHTCMVEDNLDNLRMAKSLRMRTLWLSRKKSPVWVDVQLRKVNNWRV